MLTSVSSFFHFYTISSGGAGCKGDCGACRGDGASYFYFEVHSLVSVVMVELWRLYSWVMMLKKRSSVLTQQHMLLWYFPFIHSIGMCRI